MADLIQCTFDGEAFAPSTPHQLRIARERFGEGEIIMIEAQNERSWRTHAHQFATVADLWANLPDRLSEAPYAKSADALRKHALIATGYADVQTVDAGSKAAAERVAAMLGPIATRAHGYAIVTVSGPVVRVFTPRSQSMRAMGAKDFKDSKTAVLEWIEALVSEAGEAA